MTVLRTCSFSSGEAVPAAPHKVDLGTGDLLIRNVGSETHLKSAIIPHAGSRRTPKRAAGSARDRFGIRVDSSGRRNTAYVSCSEELVQSLGRGSPAQGLSRPAVEGDRHSGELLGAVH